jgi:hypothetical protein
MGKVKDLLIERNFTVGKKVIPYSHRKCGYCKCWFGFRFDEACREIENAGYFMVVCPECEREYVYEREEHLPDENLRFIEAE